MHTITKHRSQLDLEDKGGGVLADEMGMGKSLSILSLVMKTLETARDWALSQAQSEDPPVAEQNRRSGATLIIVSSACEFWRMPFAMLKLMGPVLSVDQRMVCTDRTVSSKGITGRYIAILLLTLYKQTPRRRNFYSFEDNPVAWF